jgi:RND family efflux transporter MFP subunit
MRISRHLATWPVLLVTLGAMDVALGSDRFECLVEPYLEVEISSGIPGILDEVLVERGDFVKEGQAIARLRSDVERASYELAKARAEFAARRVQRNEELYRKQMISSHEKDELETEAQLLLLELREVEERLKLRTISSPLKGVVVERFYSPGEFVQDEVILELAQIDPLRVEVAIPVRLYGRVQVGMKADVEWEAPVLGLHRATVKVVDPVVDAASGTIGVRLELPNPKYELPAGTKCWVRFPIKTGTSTSETGKAAGDGSPPRPAGEDGER